MELRPAHLADLFDVNDLNAAYMTQSTVSPMAKFAALGKTSTPAVSLPARDSPNHNRYLGATIS